MNVVMDWARLIVQVLFCIAAIGTFARTDDPRLRNYLASATYFLAAAGSYYLTAWWPLGFGIGLLWVYKLMGLDPGDEGR